MKAVKELASLDSCFLQDQLTNSFQLKIQQSALNFFNSSRLNKEALILSQSAGFGIIIAMYPSLSAAVKNKKNNKNR